MLAKSLDLGAPAGVATHEVIVRNDRLYVASKDNSSTTCCGWTHIYDVANPANPVLLKAFLSGPRSHTALPSADGKTLIVAEERSNGNVNLFDISMIDQPNDPDNPALLSVLNRGNLGIDAHSPHHPHVHGNLLFVPWYEAGLQVFNISDPANPVHVGAFDTYPGTSTNFNGNWGVDLSLGLDTVLLSDRTRGLIVVDATGVLAPGDYNQDMTVDADDYASWRSSFGYRQQRPAHGCVRRRQQQRNRRRRRLRGLAEAFWPRRGRCVPAPHHSVVDSSRAGTEPHCFSGRSRNRSAVSRLASDAV